MGDPLGYVKLVVLVLFHAVLKQSVDQLANSRDRAFLSEVF